MTDQGLRSFPPLPGGRPPRRGPVRPEWLTRTVAITIGSALAGGLVLGGIIGVIARPDPTTSTEYLAIVDEIESARTDNDALQKRLDTANAGKRTAETAAATAKTEAEAEADKRSKELDEREAALASRETAVGERETKVTGAEQQVAANSFSGGVYVVGEKVQPGTYSTDGSSFCYYAFKSGTGSDAGIIDNNIVDGPATVTLSAGDVFESSRCGTWTKTG